ncbi:hypothetical protein ACHGLA_00710 [Streptomyces sp. YH02]
MRVASKQDAVPRGLDDLTDFGEVVQVDGAKLEVELLRSPSKPYATR